MQTHIFKSILCALLIATGCSKGPTLTVRTEYIDMKKLPSVAVDSPDPKKDTAIWGEKLIVRYNAGSIQSPLRLVTRIRLRNGVEKNINTILTKPSGVEYIVLDAYEYDLSGGVISYKVDLVAHHDIIATSKHKLWVEKI